MQDVSRKLFPAMAPPPASAETLKENSSLKLLLEVSARVGLHDSGAADVILTSSCLLTCVFSQDEQLAHARDLKSLEELMQVL
jgi:hypothetical protein